MNYRTLKRLIAVVIITTLVFQCELYLNASTTSELGKLLNDAIKFFNDANYERSIEKLNDIIGLSGDVVEVEDKTLLGKCHLLLGAIHEGKGDSKIAEENYRKAKEEYGIETIEGVDLIDLPLYKKIVKGEVVPPQGKIEIEGEKGKKRKKKFPWGLVGVGVLALIAVIILFSPTWKEKKKYTLTVTRGEGVDGTPASGATTYNEGSVVNYSYSLQSGFSNLVVRVDGVEVSPSGTITMNRNHTLEATAGANVVSFITDTDEVTIGEGSTASFNLRLSAQPTDDVIVTVGRVDGDSSITVQPGSSSLTFTTSNWNVDQAVTFLAAEDPDDTDGRATIRISANGIPDKDITVIEEDNDKPPAVTITSPNYNEEIVRGVNYEIRVTVKSEVGITRVVFRVDDFKIGEDSSKPYALTWYTQSYVEGQHTIKVTAYDINGKTGEDEVKVKIVSSN